MDESGVIVPSRSVCVLVDRHIVAARLKSDLADAYHDKTMTELDKGVGETRGNNKMQTCTKSTHAHG
jgi:hypothetical protein